MPRDIGSIIDNKYNNLSQGDKAIANTITNKKSTRDIGSIIDEYLNKDASEIVGTSNIIPVDRNDDNSVKVTFDNIYENNALAEVAKDFYYFRDQEKFESNKEAIDYYINDRTWKQANVVSIGREYSYITGENIKQDQLQRYAYLTKTWGDLPNMFQEGGGTAGQRFFRFGKNVFYAIADPINIIGVGVGGQVAKAAVKKASAEALKKAIAQAVKGKSKAAALKITDKMTSQAIGKALIGEEAVKLAEKEGFKAGIKGIAATASVDSLALGGADIARQYTEMEVNPEQKFDPVRTGTVAIAVLGLSGTAQFALAATGTLVKQGFISKSKFSNVFPEEEIGVKAGTNKLTKVKKGEPPKPKEGPIGAVSQSKFQNTLTFLKTNMFDAYDPIVKLQRDITGIGGSVKDVRRAFEAGMAESPMLLPYFQFRMTAASNARSSGFLKWGVFQPPAKNAKSASYVKGASKGLIDILKKLEADNEVASFLDYGASIRMRQILKTAKSRELKKLEDRLLKARKAPVKNATEIKKINTLIAKVKKGKLKTTVPFDKIRIDKSIDFGRLTPAQFYDKYKADFLNITKEKYIKSKDSRKIDFISSQKELKQYTDDLLKYSNVSEMIGNKEVTNILKANPEAWVPFTKVKPKRNWWQKLTRTGPTEVGKSKITVTKSPIVKLSKKELEGELDLLKNLISYTHRTVAAADMNRAKVALYEMFEAGHKSKRHGSIIADASAKGKLATDGIVRKVSASDRITHLRTTLENLDSALEKQGLKIVKKEDYSKLAGTKKEKARLIKIMEDRLKNDQTDILTFSNHIRKTDSANYIDIVYRKDAKGVVRAEFYEILDPNLHQMYKSFDMKAARHLNRANTMLEPLSVMAEKVGTITRPVAQKLGKFITYTPTFQLKNLFRDTQAATVLSAFSIRTKYGLGFIPVGTTGKGLYTAITDAEAFRISYINGLGFATRVETEGMLDTSLNKLAVDNKLNAFYTKQLKQLFGTKGKSGWLRKGADNYVDFVSKIEYASRMGEFQLAKRAGFDNLGASFAGREVTTDFGMRGSSAILNSMSRNVMFLNASMQGMYRGGRVFVEGTAAERAKVGSVLMALIAAPEIYFYYLNKDNKEYQALPDVIKQLNHIVPMGFEGVDKWGNPIPRDFFTMSKPYDFGIFGNIFHALLKGIDENSTSIGGKYLAQSLALLVPVNFIGIVPMVNTAMEPILELMMNQDAFTGSGVRKYYDQLKINDLRLKGGTKEISLQISNLTKFLAASVIPGSDDKVIDGIDPITIDFLINAYAVGVLSYGVDLMEIGAHTLGDEKKFGAPPTLKSGELNIWKDPLSIFKNVFTVNIPLKSTKYYQIYTELKREAKLKTSLDFANLSAEDGIRIWTNIETGVRKRMKEGKSAIPKEVSIYQMVNASVLTKTDKSLKKINSHIRNIPFMNLADKAAANGMSEGDYKRMKINQNLQARNDLLELVINKLADMDVDYVFENILNGKEYVSPKARDKENTLLKRILFL